MQSDEQHMQPNQMSISSDSSSSALTALAAAASNARRELDNVNDHYHCESSPVHRPNLLTSEVSKSSVGNSSCSTISSDCVGVDFKSSAKRNEPWPIKEIDATSLTTTHGRQQLSAITTSSRDPTSTSTRPSSSSSSTSTSSRKKRTSERRKSSKKVSRKRSRSNANASRRDRSRKRKRKSKTVTNTDQSNNASRKRAAKSGQRKVGAGEQDQDSYSRYMISRIPKPKRPMTAYNFFFQAERKKILDMGLEAYNAMMDPSTSSPTNGDAAAPKSGGTAGMKAQVSFQEIGKTIGRHWKNVSKDDLKRYQALAKEESKRYEREMTIYAAEVAAAKEKAILRESNEEDSTEKGRCRLSAGTKAITDSEAGSIAVKNVKESDPVRGIIDSLSKDQINQLLKLHTSTNNAGTNVHQCQASSAQPLGLNAQSVLASAIKRLQTAPGVPISDPQPPIFASPQELSLISSQAQKIAQLQVQLQNLIARHHHQQQQQQQQQDNQFIPQMQQSVFSTWSQPVQVSANHLTKGPSTTLPTFANLLPSLHMNNVNGTFLSSREYADGMNNISWQAQQNHHQSQNEQVQGGSKDLSALIDWSWYRK